MTMAAPLWFSKSKKNQLFYNYLKPLKHRNFDTKYVFFAKTCINNKYFNIKVNTLYFICIENYKYFGLYNYLKL